MPTHSSRKTLRFSHRLADAEDLVEYCYRAHKLPYHHSEQHTPDDRDGIDFIVFSPNPGRFELQVKRSDNGETLGLLLPLEEPVPPMMADRLSSKMLEKVRRHARLHPNIRLMLFVAAPTGHRTSQEIIREIWRATKQLMSLAEENGLAH